jgi:gluconate 2-dehydrogenase gamma chain
MTISRRIFLKSSGAAALAPAAVQAAPPRPEGHAAARPSAAAPAHYHFFNAEESVVMEAAVQRLIPPDPVGPSAMEAGVVNYIDNQLAGAWGAGERLYRSGPWTRGSPTQGYQLPFTPAELFRTALRGMRADLKARYSARFEAMAGADQDAYLSLLQTSAHDLDGVPANVFFESLLAMTIEGYFSDPVYGGNRDMAAWKMIGFPGAYGAYHDLVDRHGALFLGEPRSLAQTGRGVIHIMPDIPAGPSPGMATHGQARRKA